MKRNVILLMATMLCSISILAQTKITGTVVDKSNQPLMSVQVMPEAGGDAVTTDFEGRFEITVPEGTQLVFSMLGAKSKTVSAADGMVVVMNGRSAVGTTTKNISHHMTVELGYDHGFMRGYVVDGNEKTKVNGNSDGFHIGPNYRVDFMEGKHVPSLLVGFHYQMLACPLYFDASTAERKEYKKESAAMKKQGNTYSYHSDRHSFQIPVTARYTYSIDSDWNIYAFAGFQLSFVLAEMNRFKYIDKSYDGWRYSHVIDRISGRYTEYNYDQSGRVTKKTRGQKDNYAYVSPVDFGSKLGIGFTYQQFEVQLGYDIGMLNYYNRKQLTKNYSYYLTVKNSALKLTVAYRLF